VALTAVFVYKEGRMPASHSASGFISATAAAALLLPLAAIAAGPEQPTSPSAGAAQVSSPESFSDQPSAWVAAPAAQLQLDAGKVVMQSDFDASHARVNVDAAIRIHASPQTVWPLITQCDSASLLIPGLRRCKELSHAPDGTWSVVEHDIKFAAMLPMVHSVFRADYHAPYRMDFHRIAGDMKDEVGTWLLQPSPDGQTTTIEYRVAMQPGFFVPHSMVRHSLKKQLPAALLALRARAEHADAPLASSNAGAASAADQPSADIRSSGSQ
jgi:hypothetical protein